MDLSLEKVGKMTSASLTSYLVEGSPSGMEWQSTFPKTCRSLHRDRRLSKRLWGILPRYKYRGGGGGIVLRRKASTHQLFGTAARVIRDPDIYKRQSLRSCQTADGQRSHFGNVKFLLFVLFFCRTSFQKSQISFTFSFVIFLKWCNVIFCTPDVN